MTVQREGQRIGAREIEEAFARSFTEHGYLATSVNSVAQELGIAKGSVSYHIGSKEAVLYRVHMEGMREFTDKLRAIAEAPAPPEQRLRDAIHDSIRRVDPSAGPLFHLSRDSRFLEREHYKAVGTVKREYLELFTKIIEDGITSGIFRPQEKLKVVIFGILRFVGLVKDWYRVDGELTLNEITDSYWEFICRGLGYEVPKESTDSNY